MDSEFNLSHPEDLPNSVAFLQDVEGLIIGTEQKDKLKFQQLSNLKIVTKYGMGLDNLDLESIEEMVITGWVYWWSE